MTDARPFQEETFGRYRLLARLGEGGMAEVFRAKSFGVHGFEKVVVVKRLRPELAAQPAFVELFVREAKLAFRLSHANVVSVFDLGTVDDPEGKPAYFMAMEHVAGIDLARVLHRARRLGVPLPVPLAVYIAAEAAKGLDHAHRRGDENGRPLGIVHRDVSPENILLSWEGDVKVADFGVAHAWDGSPSAPGKIAYSSPEALRHEPLDGRADIFSLGCVLYGMLTLAEPFSAESAEETRRRILAGEHVPLAEARPDVPPELVTIVRTAMAPRADDRFLDAARFYEALIGHLYRAGERCTASELREALTPMKPGKAEPRLAIEAGMRTPTNGPTSSSLPRLSSVPAMLAVSTAREVTALSIVLRPRSGAVPREARARATSCLERFGGVVLDPTASPLLALFGLGEADGRDTELAVRAAQAAAFALSSAGVDLAAGVHVGRVDLGEDRRPRPDPRYTALVATAEELARAVADGIFISPAVAREIRGMFVLREHQPARGDSGFLVGDARAPEDRSRFHGRREELRSVSELFAKANAGRLAATLFRGPAGIGKTRLLAEIGRRIRKGDFPVAFHFATTPRQGREVPFSGLAAVLRAVLDVPDDALEAPALEGKLRAIGLLDDEIAAIAAIVAEGAPRSAIAAYGAVTKLLAELSEDRLTVIAWDDVDRLDAASLGFFAHAFPRFSTSRLVFLLAARPPFSASDLGDGTIARDLGDLSRDDSIALVADRLAVGSVPKPLAEFAWARAGGHPLFLEHLVSDLVDRQAIQVRDGTVRDVRLEGTHAVPRPLRAIVEERLSRLPPREADALEAGALLGDPFETSLVASLVGRPAVDVVDDLAALEDRGLVRSTSAMRHALASPLLRDVTLERLPDGRRRDLASRAVIAMERALGPRVDEHARSLAALLEAAADNLGAARYYARAARRNLAASRFEAAAVDALRAIALTEPTELAADEALALLETVAEALARTHAENHTAARVMTLVERIDRAGTPTSRVAARIAAAKVFGAQSDFTTARRLLTEADVADAPSGKIAELRLTEADLAARRGDGRSAEAAARAALDLGLSPPRERAAKRLLALGLSMLGDAKGAKELLDEAVPSAPQAAIAAYEEAKLRGIASYLARDFQAAVTSFETAVAHARALALSFEAAVTLHNLGDTLVRLNEHPRAYAVVLESQKLAEASADEHIVAQNRALLAYLDARRGREGAEEELRAVIRSAEEKSYLWNNVFARFLLGRLHEERRQWIVAAREYFGCREIAHGAGNAHVEHDCSDALERCRRAGGA